MLLLVQMYPRNTGVGCNEDDGLFAMPTATLPANLSLPDSCFVKKRTIVALKIHTTPFAILRASAFFSP